MPVELPMPPAPVAVLFDPQRLGAREQRALASHSQSWTMWAGQPLLYRQIQSLRAQGVKHVVVVLHSPDDLLLSQVPEWARVLGCQIDVQRHAVGLRSGSQQLELEQWLQLLQKLLPRYEGRGGLWIQSLDQVCNLHDLDLLHQQQHEISLWRRALPVPLSPGIDSVWCGLWLSPDCVKALKVQLQHSFRGALAWLRERLARAPAALVQSCGSCAPQSTTGVAARSFNEVRIDPVQGRVSKSSNDRHKMAREIQFYQQLPEPLRLYFPRLLSTWDHGQSLGYDLEFFPFATLSQHWVFYAVPDAVWQGALGHVLDLQAQFASWSTVDLDPALPRGQAYRHGLCRFYLEKLDRRLAQVAQPALQALLQAERVWVNGEPLLGLPVLRTQLEDRVHQLCQTARAGFVHGDLCFSNILLEPVSGMVRLIDPRGDFMGAVNAGDPRYDLAKLLHSIHGQYDFVIHDLFYVTQRGLNFELRLPRNPQLERLQEWFLQALQARGHDLEELKLLEAMLFLSMLPMHADQPLRQLAFWLMGLQILNEVLVEAPFLPSKGVTATVLARALAQDPGQ